MDNIDRRGNSNVMKGVAVVKEGTRLTEVTLVTTVLNVVTVGTVVTSVIVVTFITDIGRVKGNSSSSKLVNKKTTR